MSTLKSLAQPKIIEISNSIIRIAHPDLRRNARTQLATEIAAAGTAAVFYDNNAFKDDDWFIVGEEGDSWTEECDVNGAVTRGQAITITNSLKFNHELDASITKINERGIKIYGATTVGGAGTLIASVDAITTPLADAIMIQWDKPYTEYGFITTDTAYAYYFVKFTDGVTDSAASVYVPSAGVSYNKIEPVIQEALDIAGMKLKPGILTREMFVDWANDFQNAVTQYTYQDPRSGRFLQKDWSFEVVRDVSSLTIVEGQDEYDLSTLTETLKYPNSDKSIIDIQVGTELPLKKIAIKDFDILRQGIAKTQVNGVHLAGATTLTVDDASDFTDSGSAVIGAQTITYTAKTATTLTGVPASGSGSIVTALADDDICWQNMTLATPGKWVIFNGKLYLDYAPSSTYVGQKIKIRYFKALSRVTSVADGTEVNFVNVMTTSFVSKIYFKLRQTDQALLWDKRFNQEVLANAQSDDIPQSDEQAYYNYEDPYYSV